MFHVVGFSIDKNYINIAYYIFPAVISIQGCPVIYVNKITVKTFHLLLIALTPFYDYNYKIIQVNYDNYTSQNIHK